MSLNNDGSEKKYVMQVFVSVHMFVFRNVRSTFCVITDSKTIITNKLQFISE